MGQPYTGLATLVTIIIREVDVRSIFRAGDWDGNQNQILFILNLIKIVPDPRLLGHPPPTGQHCFGLILSRNVPKIREVI